MAGYRPYGYQYETSPRKLQPEYDYPRTNYKKKKSTSVKRGKAKQTVKKAVKKQSKRKLKYNVKPVLYIAIAFAMLLTVSYRYSLINENYNNKESLKSQLGEIEKENEQLKVNIESSLNLNSVEKTAETELGMHKLTNDQKVYVNLQKKDYVEPTVEEVVIDEQTPWWEKILSSLTKIIKYASFHYPLKITVPPTYFSNPVSLLLLQSFLLLQHMDNALNLHLSP